MIPGEPQRVSLLGLPFAQIGEHEVIDEIERLIALGGTHWIVTANVQHVALAAKDADFRQTILSSDLVTADGMPICWLASACGKPLPGRVTGADLVVPLAERCAERGWRLFLMGGGPGVAEGVVAELQQRVPGLTIAGTLTPPLMPTSQLLDGAANASMIEAIRQARPDVLLVALGSPKQEQWIGRFHASLGAGVSVGVGASFDFLVGRQSRAPRWVQRIGAEWLYRAIRSPRRLGPRYVSSGIIFARLALREWWGSRA